MPPLRVLITGVGGRIGRHVVPALREIYQLKTLDRVPTPVAPDAVITDLQDRDILRTTMEQIDVVLHLAATSDEAPFVEDLVPNNVIGVYNVFQAAYEAGVRRIVFASTVQTVGMYPPDQTITISDPVRPNTLYGATKVLGEVMGRWYHDAHGMEFVGIRIGWFHPYDSPALRNHAGARSIWLSPRDAVRLFRCAIETPDVGYALVFGTSRTEFERLSLAPARELLGYEPEDDVTRLYPGA
ncbi:MAG: NAD(P)-dependent oxidoreductase [Chloroherpetonaceae bacterium]|nr:NAD(P)-dependent oxidoreductase [Chthonomonadaceae bacterium]MDW8209254.1 NAD(P)-dependent oxidoreductase [Chloroherpetonaceae bacterium]